MNTKRILSSVVTGLILTGSLAMAAPGNDWARSKAKVRAAKQTTTMRTGGHAAVRTRSFATGGNTGVRTGTVRNRSTVFVGASSFGFGYPYYSYGSSVSFGFGYPYSYGYYPYDYSKFNRDWPEPGYYHGRIDGVMGPRTRYAIQAYERDHGLRVDGAISGSLLRNMGLRY